MIKICSTCGEEKDVSLFRDRKSSKDGKTAQCKKCLNAVIYAWRDRNIDKTKQSKRLYYSSEKGRVQKKKEDAAFVASGGRARVEARRSKRPLSEARKQSRIRYELLRRSSSKSLEEFDSFVLREATCLMRLRNKLTCCGTKWHVDHIKAVKNGGSSNHDNLQVVPAKWNQSKSNRHENRFFL